MLMFVPRKPAPAAAAVAPAADGAQLAQRVAGGDRRALEEIYRREAGTVYRYALALSGNPAWAADATQDAFIAFSQRGQGFDATRGTLGAYLAGAARHSLLALWRQHRHETPSSADGSELGDEPLEGNAAEAAGPDGGASPERLLVRAQSTAALWAALRALPLPMREVIVLVDLQERPYVEAAQIAGIELNTLRTRLHRARLRLAERLQGPTGPALQPEDLA